MLTFSNKMTALSKKSLTGALAVLALGTALTATAGSAEARPWRRHHHHGGAIAAGAIGGLALGAILASQYSAHAAPAPRYAPGYAPAYYGGECYLVRKRFVNRFGESYVRRVEVCD